MNILNYRRIDERIATSGQPDEDDLRDIAEVGYTKVINLAPHDDSNALRDEPGTVRALGLEYVHIPVDFHRPNADDFAEFERAMTDEPSDRVWIHCAANYRVTAFFGLYAMKHRGWSWERCEELIADVWDPGKYPVWRDFIDSMKRSFER